MNRRGFVLLTVLWVAATLSALSLAAIAHTKVAGLAARNRIAMTRGWWAAEACLAIALNDPQRPEDDSAWTDLGAEVACRISIEDLGTRLNVNLATPEQLRLLLANDSMVDALLDWRDGDTVPRPRGAEGAWYRSMGRRLPRDSQMADLGELAYVRGWERADTAALSRFLTAEGPGIVNLNVAPPTVLRAMPGMTPAAVDVIVRARGVRPIPRYEALLDLLPPLARGGVLAEYRAFLAATSLEPTVVLLRAEGRIGPNEPSGTIVATAINRGGTLTVVRRRMT